MEPLTGAEGREALEAAGIRVIYDTVLFPVKQRAIDGLIALKTTSTTSEFSYGGLTVKAMSGSVLVLESTGQLDDYVPRNFEWGSYRK